MVRGILEGLVRQPSFDHETCLIDFGCGTGFVIHQFVDLVDKIDGVDITPEMMDQVDLTRSILKIKNSFFLTQIQGKLS